MGNVFAASKPPEDVGSLPTDPPSLPQDKKASKDIINPGKFSELHKSTEEIFPSTFDGARIVFYKRLSNYFHVHHSIAMCKQGGSYRFGANYNVGNQTGTMDVRHMLIGEMDSSGNLSANLFHRISTRLGLKFHTVMTNGQISVAELRADYRGDRYTTSLSILNPDPLNKLQGVLVFHHLHNFTNQLALGVEIAYKRSDRIPRGQLMVASVSGRYTGEDFVASGTIGSKNLHLCYYQRASEQLHLGVEAETYFGLGESAARIGYHVCLAEQDIQFRGSFDTNMNSAAVFEKKLNPMPFTLTLSGNLNHKKNVFRLGLGVVADIE